MSGERRDRLAAIERVLCHFGADRTSGIIHSYSAPYVGRAAWLIRFHGDSVSQPYTTAQAEAVCRALVAANDWHTRLAELAVPPASHNQTTPPTRSTP